MGTSQVMGNSVGDTLLLRPWRHDVGGQEAPRDHCCSATTYVDSSPRLGEPNNNLDCVVDDIVSFHSQSRIALCTLICSSVTSTTNHEHHTLVQVKKPMLCKIIVGREANKHANQSIRSSAFNNSSCDAFTGRVSASHRSQSVERCCVFSGKVDT